MVRNLLFTLLFFTIATMSFAQVELNPNTIEFIADGEEFIEHNIHAINASDDGIDLYWLVELPDDFPSEWISQVCDINLCYAWGGIQGSPSLPNHLPGGGDIIFKMRVRHIDEGTAMNGAGYVILRLFSDPEFTNEVAVSLIPTVSTSETEFSDLSIYPNPTMDLFRIKNDDNITSVSVFNIIGRKVGYFQHSKGLSHNVSDLKAGMYIVRLNDKNGEVVKSMRLSKR